MNRWAKVEALLERELAIQERAILKSIKALVSGKKGNGNGHTKPITTKRRTSAKVKSARQLHGTYLGLTRGLSAPQKKEVKGVRADHGVREAIALAKKFRKATKIAESA